MKPPYMRNFKEIEKEDERCTTIGRNIFGFLVLVLVVGVVVCEMVKAMDTEAMNRAHIAAQSDLEYDKIMRDYRDGKAKYISRGELQAEFVRKEGKL